VHSLLESRLQPRNESLVGPLRAAYATLMTASTGDGSEVEGFPALPPRSRLSPKDGDGLGVPYLVDLALQAGAVWTITVSIHARRLGQQHVLETTEMNRQGMVTRTSSP